MQTQVSNQNTDDNVNVGQNSGGMQHIQQRKFQLNAVINFFTVKYKIKRTYRLLSSFSAMIGPSRNAFYHS
jgi:hypothetical protein